jgi:phospholipid/cholesterol/gamma-HCH transport system substrate-binding protein
MSGIRIGKVKDPKDSMAKQFEIELKVGLFVTLGIALTALAILVLGSTENLLTRQNHYSVHFQSVEGLIPGAKVVLDGVQVGAIESIDFDSQRRDVSVKFNVARKFSEWIRKDSLAEVATQGVLGDKYLVIVAGSADAPLLADNGEVAPRASKDLTQFLSRGDQLLVNLNSVAVTLDRVLRGFESGGRSETFFKGMATTAQNFSEASSKINRELDDVHLKSSLKSLDSILQKINNGSGTLGALINDPGLYDDAKALVGGANHNRIVRNLVRQTIQENNKAPAQ